jgi:hypothetical protein
MTYARPVSSGQSIGHVASSCDAGIMDISQSASQSPSRLQLPHISTLSLGTGNPVTIILQSCSSASAAGQRILIFRESVHESQSNYPTESASELYRQSDRRLSAKWLPTFEDRGCHVVSVMDPYGRILGFLDRSRYFFYQVAPQLYSRSWVDPVPDPLSFFSGSAGNRTRASGSVANNSDR